MRRASPKGTEFYLSLTAYIIDPSGFQGCWSRIILTKYLVMDFPRPGPRLVSVPTPNSDDNQQRNEQTTLPYHVLK